ncbi:MAG: hypothetical protein ACK5RG_04300 [Cyclobacteriaceae bacterium]|jgi:hypothetical protein
MCARLILLLLLILFNSFRIHAQNPNTKDGYVILLSGQFQYGFVQLDPSLNVYSECLFSVTIDKPFVKYTTDKIQGYGVIDGIQYVMKEIPEGTTTQKYFLKKEIDDNLARLYSYQNNRFFVENNGFEELKQSNYRALLLETMKNCKRVASTINKMDFSPAEMRKLIDRYLDCSNLSTSTTTPFKRFHFDVLVGAELNSSTFQLKSYLQNSAVIPLIDKTKVGAGANMHIMSRERRRIAMVIGVYYYQQSFYAIANSTAIDHTTIDKINLDYKEILVPVGLQYAFFKNERMLMPYLRASIAIPVTLGTTVSWESEKEYSTTVYFEQYELPQNLKQSLQPTVTAGAVVNLIDKVRSIVELSYISGSGELLDTSKTLSVNSSRWVFMLGIRI